MLLAPTALLETGLKTPSPSAEHRWYRVV